MCTTCGCGDEELVPVELHERILAGNERTARHNRAHFRDSGVLALNVMGSPGSGKTALLEATARILPGLRLGAVSGDLATDHDARRLEQAGIRSRAITTGQACHLDAEMVHRALHGFPWRELDLFFIENVGNLVCPAIYDLGQEANVVALSVTEGEDKPLKYPVMFRTADLVLVTKVDLLPHLDVDLARIRDAVSRVTPSAGFLELSARSGQGMGEWKAWLEGLHGSMERSTGARMHSHDDHDPQLAHDHSHTHEHSHEHSHGGVTHTHPHLHAHKHEHGHAQGPTHDHAASEPADHPHQGGGSHEHEH